jgi:hypothetical protein
VGATIDGPLSAKERTALVALMQRVYPEAFLPVLDDRSLAPALRRSLHSTALGRDMHAEIVRGLFVQLRRSVDSGDLRTALRIVDLAGRLLGVAGATSAVTRWISNRSIGS